MASEEGGENYLELFNELTVLRREIAKERKEAKIQEKKNSDFIQKLYTDLDNTQTDLR